MLFNLSSKGVIQEFQLLLDRDVDFCIRFGLKINTKKSKFMVVSKQPTTAVVLKVGTNPLDKVNKIKYLA